MALSLSFTQKMVPLLLLLGNDFVLVHAAPFPENDTTAHAQEERWLFSANSSSVFYIMYMCVLLVCCLAPCTYYLRLYFWQRSRLRRLEALERAGLVAALQRTMAAATADQDTMEAVNEERRARIVQLMEPVQKILGEDDFRQAENSTKDVESPIDDEKAIRKMHPKIEKALSQDDTASSGGDDDDDDDGEKLQVRISKDRWVPAQCTICLSRYRPGVTAAWASNPSCPHVFHASCIQTWLMRHDDPVCPCCRRDFLVDPYDSMEEKQVQEMPRLVLRGLNVEEEKSSEDDIEMGEFHDTSEAHNSPPEESGGMDTPRSQNSETRV